MTHRSALASLVLAGALLAPAAADAHVSLHPNTIPAGAFATVDVRVPGEQAGAHVTRVDVLFPHGFSSVDYAGVPGWTAKVVEAKLAPPLQEDGETIDTEVEQIIWTWKGPDGQVGNGQFIDFPLSLAVPATAAGHALEFRTVQAYSNGATVHWIDPSLQAEHPSPRINVTAPGGVIEDVAGDEAGPPASQLQGTQSAASTGTAGSTSGGSSDGLAIAALVVGALGLAAGLIALRAARRANARAG
jgi:uncharacterized protein YcnI